MYILELKIKEGNNNSKYLNKVFFVKFKIINILINRCEKMLNNLNNNKEYKLLLKEKYEIKNELKNIKDKKIISKYKKEINKINKKLNQIKKEIGLTKGELYKWSKPLGKKYKNYISSQMLNAICDSVLKSIEKILYSDGKQLHHKRFDDISSVSAKSIKNGFTYLPIKENKKVIDYNYLIIQCPNNKVQLQFEIKDNDYQKDGYRPSDVKYIRLSRKIFNGGYKYYLQFVTKGIPPLKVKHGKGISGIDPGVSSVAAYTNNCCILEDLSPNINKYNKEIIKYQREIERKNKQNNPNCYNEDGTIKKGSKFKISKTCKKAKRKLQTKYRQKAESTKQNQSKIANKIIKNSECIYCEKVDYKQLQERLKNTEHEKRLSAVKTKTGVKNIHKYKKKKRFGKSLQNKAPSQFVNILKYKCEYHEIPFIYIETKEFKASQYNHQKDEYIKKELNKRWNELELNGKKIKIQRDLYSAFLIRNTDSTLKQTDKEKCNKNFEQFVKKHNKCIKKIKKKVKIRPSSFGF